jgi:short-subunit dehydrogenase
MADTRRLALVTGASSGIGLELAKQFAKRGYDLVIAAENDEIRSAAADLAEHSDVHVEPVQVDLRKPEGVEELYSAVITGARQLDVAALNAGIGRGGMKFVETELADDLSIIDLNVRSTVHLSKLILRDMAGRRQGRVLYTSSIASMMPGSYQAVYNASKSFIQSFAEAVRDELKDSGVTITSLMPGPTATNFFSRALMENTLIGKMPKDDPAQVAKQAVDALMRGDEKVIAESVTTKLMGTMNRVLPDNVKAKANKLIAAPLGHH